MYGCESWTMKKAECQRLMLSNCGAEMSLESPLNSKEIKPVNPKGNQPWIFIHWKDWCWRWSSNTLATWWKELTHWKRPWCWERLKAQGGGDDRGGDGWMASPNEWTWVWASFGSWWWTGNPGVLQSMGLQRVDLSAELDWTLEADRNQKCLILFPPRLVQKKPEF